MPPRPNAEEWDYGHKPCKTRFLRPKTTEWLFQPQPSGNGISAQSGMTSNPSNQYLVHGCVKYIYPKEYPNWWELGIKSLYSKKSMVSVHYEFESVKGSDYFVVCAQPLLTREILDKL